jgi:hypothetical protein
MSSLNLKDQLIFWMIAIVVMLLPNTELFSQQYKVSSAFDSTTIRIGDQIKLHFDVDMPLNAKVSFPSFKDTITGKIEVIKTFRPDSSKKDGKLHIRQDLLITSFDSGYHQIPPLNFAFEVGNSRDTLKTVPLYLTVNALPVDTTKEIKDIKAPLGVPFSILDYWQYILGFFGLIFIAFAVWYVIKLRKKQPLFGGFRAADPPHIIALRELDGLRAEKLWQQDKTKQYYTRLTEIIRTYIERRYEIDALEMTSDEILIALKNAQMDDFSQIELLQKMFQTADLVKFAKGQPLPDENEVNLLNAYQFVNNTKIIVSIQAENDAEHKDGEESLKPDRTDNVAN